MLILMNKKQKSSIIIASLASIAVAGSLIAGSTYALFTSESKTNIAVNSGTVNVTATIDNLLAYSPTEINTDGTIYNDTNAADNTNETKVFVNQGTAAFEGNKLTLSNMTPGDKVTFDIAITNNSNVAAKYRTVITSDDGELFDILELKIGDEYGVSYSSWSTADSKTIPCSVELPCDVGNEYQNKECNVYFTVEAIQANASTERYYDTLEEAFNLTDNEFGYGNSHTDAINLDGQGMVYINKWADLWVSADLTIKGVTFLKGATISLNSHDNLSINVDNCVFNACKQSELVQTTSNSKTNSGDGMCFDIDKYGAKNVNYKITNCKFIGENDESLLIYGSSYNSDGTVSDGFKKRAHGIAFDAISGSDNAGGSIATALIRNCQISGVRGNAIQLYGNTGDITIKNTKILSWGVNCGDYIKGTQPKNGNANAIRGDYTAGGAKKLNLINVYFGLDEGANGSEGHIRYLAHVNVGSYAGNTITIDDESTGTKKAGKYTYIDN